jgi:hypothetical protein
MKHRWLIVVVIVVVLSLTAVSIAVKDVVQYVMRGLCALGGICIVFFFFKDVIFQPKKPYKK